VVFDFGCKVQLGDSWLNKREGALEYVADQGSGFAQCGQLIRVLHRTELFDEVDVGDPPDASAAAYSPFNGPLFCQRHVGWGIGDPKALPAAPQKLPQRAQNASLGDANVGTGYFFARLKRVSAVRDQGGLRL
jgi:hypothetical protein